LPARFNVLLVIEPIEDPVPSFTAPPAWYALTIVLVGKFVDLHHPMVSLHISYDTLPHKHSNFQFLISLKFKNDVEKYYFRYKMIVQLIFDLYLKIRI
jgi:hypothetical protein